jgi:orotidine-5'-phosphate decarboxylase
VKSTSASSVSKKRVIVALDVATADEARSVVAELRAEAGAFKIGLQLFTAAGPALVREVAAQHRVFLDLKFHDIPNTVAMAGVEAARLGVWMFNVHASGGSEMVRRTISEVDSVCIKEKIERPMIIGVTVLTSSDANTLTETGIERSAGEHVVKLASLAANSGLNGVVASPLEVSLIRSSIPDPGFLIVTPGVRPESATYGDQKRVTTPRQAASEGSDYLVIGRPILESHDRLATLTNINREIETAIK